MELVISQAFCSLEGQIRGSVNDYAVKPIGLSEWLSNSSKLSQLECVHNSLKLEKDVQLGLCPKTRDNMKVIARTQRDDMNDVDLRPEDVLPNEQATTITYDNMMILIGKMDLYNVLFLYPKPQLLSMTMSVCPSSFCFERTEI